MRLRPLPALVLTLAGLANAARAGDPAPGPPLPGTQPLTWTGDLASKMVDGIDRFLLRKTEESITKRAALWKRDTTSPEAYSASVAPNRERLAHLLGVRDARVSFDAPELVGTAAQPALVGRGEGFDAFAVRWPAFGDVHGEGLLLVPAGRPKVADVVALPDADQSPEQIAGLAEGVPPQSQSARRLAESGCRVIVPVLIDRKLITFAPQNSYIFGDRFRTLQRKANPLKKTLFAVIVPQHRQITDWLKSLPFVDPSRVAFYGLSYGGKSAMRIPPLVENYCLSICSADFNEWVWKNASTRSPYSYVWTNEYEIFEFDLGGTFNYAEMAALIAPRPFMVERGHLDGVAPDETVGYEFAKVRFLYEARLGLKDRCRIEWFVGPHTIHGAGTFDFLHRHLSWARRGD